jgi:hypothetical protein
MTKEQKLAYHMQDAKGYASIHQLSEIEAEQLREKGWLVVPVACVKEDLHGHLHVIDDHGRYVGARMLDAVQAGDLVRQGYHLVHVGDGYRDLAEIRKMKVDHAE